MTDVERLAIALYENLPHFAPIPAHQTTRRPKVPSWSDAPDRTRSQWRNWAERILEAWDGRAFTFRSVMAMARGTLQTTHGATRITDRMAIAVLTAWNQEQNAA